MRRGPGQAISRVGRRRGDADRAPGSLRLIRERWLDFGGDGYTLRDTITGEIRRSSRLEVHPGIELGQTLRLEEHFTVAGGGFDLVVPALLNVVEGA